MRRKVPVGLLAAPLAWLLVAYLGALAMIFATAFFTTDSFTGAVVRDFSLENYREVLTPTYLRIIVRTVLIASLVTVLCILIAMSVLALLGLRYPQRMLPVLLFEVAWKMIWLAAVVVPLVQGIEPFAQAFAGAAVAMPAPMARDAAAAMARSRGYLLMMCPCASSRK